MDCRRRRRANENLKGRKPSMNTVVGIIAIITGGLCVGA